MVFRILAINNDISDLLRALFFRKAELETFQWKRKIYWVQLFRLIQTNVLQ